MKNKVCKLISLCLVIMLSLANGLSVYAIDGDTSLDAESTILRNALSGGKSIRGEVDEITTDIDLILTPSQLQHYSEPKHIYFVTDVSDSKEVEEEIRLGIHNMLNQTVLHHIYVMPFWYNNMKVNECWTNTPIVYSQELEDDFWNHRHKDCGCSVSYYNNIQGMIEMALDSENVDNKEVIVYAKDHAKITLDSKYDGARIHWIRKNDVNDTGGKLAGRYTGIDTTEKLSRAFDEIIQDIMQDTSKINIAEIPIASLFYNETLPVGVELVDNKITLLSHDGERELEFNNIKTTGNNQIGLTINHEFFFDKNSSPLTIKEEGNGIYRLQGKMKYEVKYHNTGEMDFLGGWISPINDGNGARFFMDKFVVQVRGEYPKINLKVFPNQENQNFNYSYTTKIPQTVEDEYQFHKTEESDKNFVVLRGNDRYAKFEITGKDLNPDGTKVQILRGPVTISEEEIEAFEEKVKAGEWREPEIKTSGEGEVTSQNPQGLWIQRYNSYSIDSHVDKHDLRWKNKTILFQHPIATTDDELQGAPEDRKGYVMGYKQESDVSPKVAHSHAFFAPTSDAFKDGHIREIRQMWGYFQLPKEQPSGEYYFAFFVDDGAYAHIITPDAEGVAKTNVLVDSLKPSAPYLATVPNSKAIQLEQGVKYPIYIEYYNIGAHGALEMFMRPESEGAWTYKNGQGSTIQETDDTINLSSFFDQCFSYSKVTEIKDIKSVTMTGEVKIPNDPGIYYVAVKASTKGGAQVETVMGPFIRIDTTTTVNYPELCSADPIGQLQLALDIDVSNKAYVIDDTDLGLEIVIPETQFVFKLKDEVFKDKDLSSDINSKEIYQLKEAPKVYNIEKVGGQSKITSINNMGPYLKNLTIEKNGEDILVTLPQRVMLEGENYRDLLKGSILITVNLEPHSKLKANQYTLLVKNNANATESDVKKINYILDVKTKDWNTGVRGEENGVKEIKVQLLNKRIH